MNGTTRQQSSIEHLIWSVAETVAYLSTLLSSGSRRSDLQTPSVKAGDLEGQIDGLGSLRESGGLNALIPSFLTAPPRIVCVLRLPLKGWRTTTTESTFVCKNIAPPEFEALNPSRSVPLLCDGPMTLGQSLAIIDYLVGVQRAVIRRLPARIGSRRMRYPQQHAGTALLARRTAGIGRSKRRVVCPLDCGRAHHGRRITGALWSRALLFWRQAHTGRLLSLQIANLRMGCDLAPSLTMAVPDPAFQSAAPWQPIPSISISLQDADDYPSKHAIVVGGGIGGMVQPWH